MRHHSCVSSVLVYAIVGILLSAMVFILYQGWMSLPVIVKQTFEVTVLYGFAGLIFIIFACIAGMFILKIRAQHHMDMQSLREAKATVARRRLPK